jgi:hypothetical protein
VPCKFYKVGGCTAGSSCPFSHSSVEPEAQKETCTWFIKGNCKFGHKCALAHVLPGQSMAMDRKNKKAAQTAASGALGEKGGKLGGGGRGGTRREATSSAPGGNRLPLLAGGATAPTRIMGGPESSFSGRPPMTMPLKATISPSAPAPPLKDTDFTSFATLEAMEGVHPSTEISSRTEGRSVEEGLGSGMAMMGGRKGWGDSADSGASVGGPSSFSGLLSAQLSSSVSQQRSTGANGFGSRNEYDISIEYDEFGGVGDSKRVRRGAEIAVEDEDLWDFLPSSLNDLLTPEERNYRMSRNSSGQPSGVSQLTNSLATANTDSGNGLGHRYSRSVPAPTLLGDIKSIWADTSAPPLPSSPPTHRGTPSVGYGTRFDPYASNVLGDEAGLSMSMGSAGTASSIGMMSSSNASAAFLPGLHHHYLNAKAKQAQAQQAQLGLGGIGRQMRGASMGLPSSASSSSAFHTHTHGNTQTTYRTTPSPFDLTQALHQNPQTARPIPSNLANQKTITDDPLLAPHLLSPSSRALQAHAPGQSLPQGLAAGYPWIHALPPLTNIASPPTSGSFVPGTSPGANAAMSNLSNEGSYGDWPGPNQNAMGAAGTAGLETMFSRLSYSAATRSGPANTTGTSPGPSRNVSGGRYTQQQGGPLSPLSGPMVRGASSPLYPGPTAPASSKSARDVDFTLMKTREVGDGNLLKNILNFKMKLIAGSGSGRSNESVPPNEKPPAPVSGLIPPPNPILIPPPSAQSYPPSMDPRNHRLEMGDMTQPVVIHQQPFIASPQCSVTVLVASDAKRHLESNMHALERILTDFAVQRDLWISQVGFDEELLCGGRGYVQEVLITILEDLDIEGGYSMIQKIGKILSPFPGVIRMPGCFFRTPVFKHDGTVWETYDDFVRDHVNTLDPFEYDSARHLHMAGYHEVEEPPVDQEKESLKTESNSTATTSNSCSVRAPGGNRSKKAKGKRPEHTEQEDPSDSSDDSYDPDPCTGTRLRTRPRIQFEIITEVMGQSQRETLKIAGAFTFKVWGVLSSSQ